jgi:hypothetical protein
MDLICPLGCAFVNPHVPEIVGPVPAGLRGWNCSSIGGASRCGIANPNAWMCASS